MGLSFIFLFNILDELFALRSTALVEARIDGVFVRVHQFAHGHTQEQRLAIAFRDAKATKQLRCYLASFIIGIQQVTCSSGVDAIVISQLLFPKGLVCTTLVIPTVTSPSLIPHPVAIQLLQALTIGQLISCIRPIPIGSLWIKMQTLGVMHTMHGLNGLLDKGRTAPAPGLEVSKDMYIINMYRSSCSQLTMGLAPRSTRLIGCQRFACIFRHGVDVRIKGQRLFENQRSIGIVRTEHYRRNVCSTASLQSVLNARDNGFLHPDDVIVNGSHCFA